PCAAPVPWLTIVTNSFPPVIVGVVPTTRSGNTGSGVGGSGTAVGGSTAGVGRRGVVGTATTSGGSAVATTSVDGSPVTSSEDASIQPCSSERGGKTMR